MTHQPSQDQDLRTALDVKLASANGKHWRLEGPGWTMQPIGQVSADEARDICERALSALTAPPRSDHAGGVSLSEACEPWAFHVGEPPEYDSPLSGVFGAGITYTERHLAELLGVTDYEAGDGSEDFRTDAGNTLLNILAAAGLYDRDEAVFAKLTPAQAPDKAAEREGVKKKIARALLNESEAGGGGFDDMADAVLAVLDRAALAPRPNGTEASRDVGVEVARAAFDKWFAATGLESQHKGLTACAWHEAWAAARAATPTPSLSPDSTGPTGAGGTISFDPTEDVVRLIAEAIAEADESDHSKLYEDNARAVIARLAAITPSAPIAAPVRTALLAAKQFIANGVEMGFIRMPDANTPDTARDTPRLIDEALASLAAPVRDDGAREALLLEVLRDCRRTIANPNPGICCTVWFDDITTLQDHIDLALQQYDLTAPAPAGDVPGEAQVKALGAAISRREWGEVEAVHAAMRDAGRQS